MSGNKLINAHTEILVIMHMCCMMATLTPAASDVPSTLHQPVIFFLSQARSWTVECSAPQFSVFLVCAIHGLSSTTVHTYITVTSHGGLSLLNITASILASDCSLDLHLELSGGGR